MRALNFFRVFFTVWICSVSFVSWASPAAKPDPEVTVTAVLDKTSVAIGDKIRYSLVVSAKNDIEVEFPDFEGNLGNFNLKDFGSGRKVFWGRQKITRWYVLDTYVIGKQALPKALVKYRRQGENDWNRLESEEKEIEVKSLLDKPGVKRELRPIKDPLDFPFCWRYLLLGILFLLFILAGIAIFRKKKNNLARTVELPPAHQIALQKLNELKTKGLIAQGKIKEYYIEISGIIRHYIEDRFKLSAPEMTSEEFLLKARDAQELSLTQKDLLSDFLLSCDLVKFARYSPSEKETETVFESARRFVEETKEVIDAPA
ncbi:MAG: hypothetical protein AABZ65_03890 [Candidatus Omnitrophota bacterium]